MNAFLSPFRIEMRYFGYQCQYSCLFCTHKFCQSHSLIMSSGMVGSLLVVICISLAASAPFKVIFWPYPNPLHTCSSKRTRLKYSLNWWRSCRDYLGLLGHLSGSMGWRKELERSPREFLPGSYGPAGQHITIINCSIHLGLSNWHTKTTNRIYHSRWVNLTLLYMQRDNLKKQVLGRVYLKLGGLNQSIA